MEALGKMLASEEDNMPNLKPIEQFSESTNFFRCGAYTVNFAGSQFSECYFKWSKRFREAGLEEEWEIRVLGSDSPQALRKVHLLVTKLQKFSKKNDTLQGYLQVCKLPLRKIPTYCRKQCMTR